jgi:glycosyltransferase involved in cell wall biosynthesis
MVIYPPVNTEEFPFLSQKEDFYLTVSRLVSYKQVTLIVKAFNQLQKPLVIIGTGSEMDKILEIAKPNIQILGWQPDNMVKKYMANARGFVYAACEDFGIALVEAQACGTPAIAYGAGGALETVRDIRSHGDTGTGIFFQKQTEASLIEAVEAFEANVNKFNPGYAKKHAAQFSKQTFTSRYLNFVHTCEEKNNKRKMYT